MKKFINIQNKLLTVIIVIIIICTGGIVCSLYVPFIVYSSLLKHIEFIIDLFLCHGVRVIHCFDNNLIKEYIMILLEYVKSICIHSNIVDFLCYNNITIHKLYNNNELITLVKIQCFQSKVLFIGMKLYTLLFIDIKLYKLLIICIIIVLYLIVLFYIFLYIILFNIKSLILIILSIIFIKALSKNFIKKHSNFLGSIKNYLYKNKTRLNIIELYNSILLNKLKIIKFILKNLLLTMFIRIIVRNSTLLLFNDQSIEINYIIAILLSTTIFYYIFNLTAKLIKKEKITFEDYYLYNNYVVEKINIYNLIYIVGMYLVIKNYTVEYYITVLFLLLFFILFSLNYYTELSRRSSHPSTPSNVIPLESGAYIGGLFNIPLLMAIAAKLAVIIGDEVKNFSLVNEDNPRIELYGGEKSVFNIDGKEEMATGFLKSGSGGTRFVSRPTPTNDNEKKIIENVFGKIEKTPLVSIGNALVETLNSFAVKPSLNQYDFREIRTYGYFVRKDFQGCLVKGRTFLIFALLKDNCTKYIPNYYINESNLTKSLGVLSRNISAGLDEKEQVDLNDMYKKEKQASRSMIIFTPAEYIEEYKVYKCLRPDMFFTDLHYEYNKDLYFSIEYFKVNGLENGLFLDSFRTILEKPSENKDDIEGMVKLGHISYGNHIFNTYSEYYNKLTNCSVEYAFNKDKPWLLRIYTPPKNSESKEIKAIIYTCQDEMFEGIKEDYSRVKLSFDKSRSYLQNAILKDRIERLIKTQECFGISINKLNNEFFLFDFNTNSFSNADGDKHQIFSMIFKENPQKFFKENNPIRTR